MNAPLIAVAAGFMPEGRQGLPATYGRALHRCGALPVLVGTADPRWPQRMDGLLLAGGGDMDPAHFGQENLHSQDISPERDALELALFDAFYRAGKPIFGICRGHQVINVALGGTLFQDIRAQMAIDHPYTPTVCHDISVAEGSFLAAHLQTGHGVNSTHHQAVDRVAPGLAAVAWSEGGRIIEALQATDRPVWSVQWHPERMMDDPAMAAMLGEFIRRCKEDSIK